MKSLPEAITEHDRKSFEDILSVPWLKDSIYETGSKWGRKVADVKISEIPRIFLAQAFLNSEDPEILDLVIFRWDRYEYKGWPEAFVVKLTFPDESILEVEVPPSAKIEDYHTVRITVPPGVILRERVPHKNRVIPRVLFNLSAPLHKQLSQSVRRLLKNVRKMNDMLQTNCLYLVIEDDAGRKEVENSGIENFLEAYNSLRPGSFKADLLRYYLLYRYGGVYMDDKTFLRYSLDSGPFDSLLEGEKSTSKEPCEMFIGFHKTTEIAFMGARQGSPIMRKALEKGISNVMERFYGTSRLSITGNLMFEKVLFADSVRRKKVISEESWSEIGGENVAILPIPASQERITTTDNEILWQRQAIPSADWPKPTTYYANLWNQRKVYTDGNPDTRVPVLFPSASAESRRETIAYTLFIIAFLCFGFLISRYPKSGWMSG